ncbi:hypothetical protein [Plantactinospora sp. WMMB782]|uniref:hypothetical protein n=1 Tax=Plantactinospora sp. WMMB782 TaxID=3404121 RepID=UPI003B959583
MTGGGGSPFYIAFLNGRPDTFVVGYAVGDGIAIGKIDAAGVITVGPLVQIDTSAGRPSELCWLSVSPDGVRHQLRLQQPEQLPTRR